MTPDRFVPATSARLAWWVVCWRDLQDLWVGGKALFLLLAYTAIIGVQSFLAVRTSVTDPTPPKEMIFTTFDIGIYICVCMGVIIGADTLSGPRERSALETLLLTPASRRQIVFGKYLASVSVWPAALLVTIPCLAVLAQGDAVFGPAVVWGALIGFMLVLGFTGMAMLVSYWCSSNRTSYFVSLTLFLLFLLPALLPGRAQKGLVGKFFQRANPLAAADQYLERIIVNNRSYREYGDWLRGPVWFLILIIVLLLLFAGPRLRLQAGWGRLFRFTWGRTAQPAKAGGM
jgi:ABC-type transport system involved in cytochrome c biogenesis permease component